MFSFCGPGLVPRVRGSYVTQKLQTNDAFMSVENVLLKSESLRKLIQKVLNRSIKLHFGCRAIVCW